MKTIKSTRSNTSWNVIEALCYDLGMKNTIFIVVGDLVRKHESRTSIQE